MSPKIFFIVNPNSRSGSAKKKWETYILPEALRLFPSATWAFSQSPHQASLLAFNARNCGYDIVVAVGGDGTINEVVNGLMGNPLACEKQDSLGFPLTSIIDDKNKKFKIPTLACIPVGTGCDFIKTLHIPNDINTALNIIKDGRKINCDVGLIQFLNNNKEQSVSHSRYFINIGGCGANGDVVRKINESKKYFGRKGSFWVAAVQSIIKNSGFPVKISYDNKEAIDVNLQVLFICNGQYCGGGMRIAKEASLQSGFFRILQVKKMNKLKSVLLTNRLYSGNYTGLQENVLERTAQTVQIFPINNAKIPVECDGEQPGFAPVNFSILPQALSVCVKSNS